jgi:RNA polymerase sigma-70 factor (ECF subfamily)
MRNIFINNYRHSKKMRLSATNVESDAVIYSPSAVSYSNGYNTTRLAEVHKAIDNLPDTLRTTFELYCKGYKYHEIASILNEPLGTIKSRMHFARKTLASAIDD